MSEDTEAQLGSWRTNLAAVQRPDYSKDAVIKTTIYRRGGGSLISCVRYFICLFGCLSKLSKKKNENILSYQHQSLNDKASARD